MRRLSSFRACLAAGLIASALVPDLAARADSFDVKRCLNMGNALESPSEGEWGHTIDLNSFETIKRAGFDTVRIPVRWDRRVDGNFIIRDDFKARVKSVVDAALAADLNVIVNVHHFDPLYEDPETHGPNLVKTWAQISQLFSGYPDNLYFELINEPTKNFKDAIMRQTMRAAFMEVRKTHPTRMIIMGGQNWNSLDEIGSIPQIDDPNQVYTFHFYDPFEFTHQKTSWTHLKNSGARKFGSREDMKLIEERAQMAANIQNTLGIPLFMGEFGAYEKAPYEDQVEYYAAVRKAFGDRGISWCAWSFTATFPLYDQDKKQWDENKLAALGLAKNAAAPVAPVKSGTSGTAGLSLDDAFRMALRDTSPNATLMHRPFANELAHYGLKTDKIVKDAGAPGGEALEASAAKGSNPWDAAVSGPIAAGLKKGDQIAVVFYARSVKGPGELSTAAVQLNREPYNQIAAASFSLSENWERYEIRGVADRDYDNAELAYTFHLGSAKQTVRFGPIFALNLGQ